MPLALEPPALAIASLTISGENGRKSSNTDLMKGSLNDPILWSMRKPTDGRVLLDQAICLFPGRGDQCRPRSKEGLVTSGNSRVTVIEASNQLPKFGRVSPIVD